MRNEPPGSDPKSVWRSQAPEGTRMSLLEIRQKVRKMNRNDHIGMVAAYAFCALIVGSSLGGRCKASGDLSQNRTRHLCSLCSERFLSDAKKVMAGQAAGGCGLDCKYRVSSAGTRAKAGLFCIPSQNFMAPFCRSRDDPVRILALDVPAAIPGDLDRRSSCV